MPSPTINPTPIPNLYISSLSAPNHPPTLQTHNITHILSLTSARDLPVLPPALHIHHLHIPIDDNPYEDILCLLEGLCVWIAAALCTSASPGSAGRGRNNVLVHCVQGASRSGAVVTAYTMRAADVGYEVALARVREGRAGVLLNSGFAEQLRVWRGLGWSVYGEGGRGWKGEYVVWKEGRGILMSREQREMEEALRERMREVVVRLGGTALVYAADPSVEQ